MAYLDVNAVLTSTRFTRNIQVGGQRVGSVLKNLSTGVNTYYQVVTDHVGTSSMVVTGTSANGWTLTSPYGKVLARKKNAAVLDVDYLYTGKELDAESGLSYFGARYLDHQTVGARGKAATLFTTFSAVGSLVRSVQAWRAARATVAIGEGVAATGTASAEGATVATAAASTGGAVVTLEQSVGRGLVKPDGKLGQVLAHMDAGYASAAPRRRWSL